MSQNDTGPSFPIVPSQRLYDPSDPSTYPSTAATSGLFTSSTQALHPNATGSTYPGPAQPGGRYTGVPEL
jgi:hypothetical protein